MFYVELRDNNGKLQNIVIEKLKNKLGTKALPTTELRLTGTPAILVGPVGKGVATISTLFNLTRIHNSVHSVSSMRRSIAIARDYAFRRASFGKYLSQHPLHYATLADLEVTFRGNLIFVLDISLLLGQVECNCASKEDEELLRLLTPLAKLYTAKEALPVISECIEALGGTGYIEDATPLPSIFRSSQVLTLWEGTTNILSLDVLRALAKSASTFSYYVKVVSQRINSASSIPDLKDSVDIIHKALEKTANYAQRMFKTQVELMETGARIFAYSLSSIYAAGLLLDHASWSKLKVDADIARNWCNKKNNYTTYFRSHNT